MIDLNVLNAEEILQHGASWAAANPCGGDAYGELADFQAEAGRVEDAILNYLQAVVHTPLNNRDSYGRYHFAKTQLLLKEDRLDAAMSWLKFLDRGRLDEGMRAVYEPVIRETRYRYLTEGERVDSRLSELKRRLERDPQHHSSWRDLAEMLVALGHERMENSDYFRGQAFLKLSHYVLSRLKRVDRDFDEALFRHAGEELARALVAVGLGGKRHPLVTRHSDWNYHYQPGGLPGREWARLGFTPDDDWKSGRAPLGYGDGDEETVLDFGEDEDNKPVTAYFRLVFELADTEDLSELRLGVLHDDGMVAYLNGDVIARSNMLAGTVEPETLAPESRGSPMENEYWMTTVSGERLRPGKNVIAVEVHQNDRDSLDLGFDLELFSEAVSSSEVASEVESGRTLKLLNAWVDRLPEDFVSLVQAL